MLSQLEGYDWQEAFAYAGEVRGEGEYGCYGSANISEAIEDSGVPCDPFSREDVAEIVAMEDGENDGPDWIIVGRLNDGRWFSLSAGCDYTGWD
jgi:hypothetical protein